jgi:hypothetical protein
MVVAGDSGILGTADENGDDDPSLSSALPLTT